MQSFRFAAHKRGQCLGHYNEQTRRLAAAVASLTVVHNSFLLGKSRPTSTNQPLAHGQGARASGHELSDAGA